MPYIPEYKREHFSSLEFEKPGNVGELNYCFTVLARDYIKRDGGGYSAINDVIGALECAKLELYRRLAAPYEDKKIIENGDVYNVDN